MGPLRSLVSSLLVLLLLAHGPALAEGDDTAAAKPEVKHLTVAVLGDSLGDGIWGGLYRKLVRDKRYTVFRGAKNSVGFGGETLIDQIDKAFAAGPTDGIEFHLLQYIALQQRNREWLAIRARPFKPRERTTAEIERDANRDGGNGPLPLTEHDCVIDQRDHCRGSRRPHERCPGRDLAAHDRRRGPLRGLSQERQGPVVAGPLYRWRAFQRRRI